AVTALAVARVLRRRDDCDPERLWLATAAVVVSLGGLLYDDRYPLQVAFLVAPWYALVVARLLVDLAHSSSLRMGRGWAAAAVAPRPAEEGPAYRARAEAAFAAAIAEAGGPVILPAGGNLFEGLRQDPAALREIFFAACRRIDRTPIEIGRFPSGTATGAAAG